MMWPTIDGHRALQGAEAELVRRVVVVLLERLVTECHDQVEAQEIGIDWFDQWDAEQRLWLLERVTVALFTHQPPPSPAAMWEATIDAVFCEVVELIGAEIEEASLRGYDPSWRELAFDAFRSQYGRTPNITVEETDLVLWRRVTTQIADRILGVTSYQKAESLRDGDIQNSRRFLLQKGLPEDFLQRIPPLRTPEQTRRSIARIESIVGRLE